MTAWVPQACTLPTVEQPLRVAEFDALFARATGPPRRPDRGRLSVVLADDAVPLARDLVARETACCSFFTFTLQPCDGGTELAVAVPPAQVGVLDALEARIEAVAPASGAGPDQRSTLGDVQR